MDEFQYKLYLEKVKATNTKAKLLEIIREVDAISDITSIERVQMTTLNTFFIEIEMCVPIIIGRQIKIITNLIEIFRFNNLRKQGR